jgi:hypothetical protein
MSSLTPAALPSHLLGEARWDPGHVGPVALRCSAVGVEVKVLHPAPHHGSDKRGAPSVVRIATHRMGADRTLWPVATR